MRERGKEREIVAFDRRDKDREKKIDKEREKSEEKDR